MNRLTVMLDQNESYQLWELAKAECRSPKDQIRYLVREAARLRGVNETAPVAAVSPNSTATDAPTVASR